MGAQFEGGCGNRCVIVGLVEDSGEEAGQVGFFTPFVQWVGEGFAKGVVDTCEVGRLVVGEGGDEGEGYVIGGVHGG